MAEPSSPTLPAQDEPDQVSIDVVHVGLGPIGRQILDYMSGRSAFRSVGAADIDPAFVGSTLAELPTDGPGAPLSEVRIVGDISELPAATPGAVAIHCAGSTIAGSAPVLRALLSAGYHVVSTCEELSDPWVTNAALAAELDRLAREHGVTLLGTGVNPGFAMDYLPVVLAGSQRRVHAVTAHRVQDAGVRRVPLQRKVGAGLSVEEFEEKVDAGTIRHMGFQESAWAIDRALGLGCTDVTETIEPVVAEGDVPLGEGVIEAGRVLGVDQLVLGSRNGETVIRLHLQMAVGLSDPRDVVTLHGEPGLESVTRGLHGDTATASIVVNSLGRVQKVAPGLRTADEMPASPVHW